MTGWGQDGPLAPRAGHDINYIALAGVLHAFGRKGEAPVPPLNLVGDFGGGGMLLGFGVACALLEAARSGRGQVVDAAMVEGASLLGAMFAGFLASRKLVAKSEATNILDTGAPWYNVYETKDGKHISIGSIETRFYEELLQKLGVPDLGQHDRKRWPEMQRRSSPRPSKPRPATSGARCSKARTPASRRCFRGRRRGATRTMSRASHLRKWQTWSNRRPRRASRARPARCGARRRSAARAAGERWQTGASTAETITQLSTLGLGMGE